jgi:serine/threonine protein kinase
MATVHFGRLSGPAGFSRTVAIKRLHPNLAKDPEFVAMFLDEARLAARIRHPNVIPTLDVVATEGEIFLVMDYVQGESLGRLRAAMRAMKRTTDPRIVAAVMSGVLHGLHAAHEAKSEQGQSLNIVHRDVSPQNILVGVEGVARVLDFGVAKAMGRVQSTREGQIKGKIAYMPPEQLRGGKVTRQADVYAAAVVTWETLTGQRLFSGEHEGALVTSILMEPIKAPSEVAPHVPAEFDRVVMRGLERDPAMRYATARDMALDLERCAGIASTSEVGEWVESLAGAELTKRAALMAAIEGATPTRPSDRAKLATPSATVHPATPSEAPTNPTLSAPALMAKAADAASGVSHVSVNPDEQGPRNRRVPVAVIVATAGLGLAMGFLFLGGRSGHDGNASPSAAHTAAAASENATLTAKPPEAGGPSTPSGESSAASVSAEALPLAGPAPVPATSHPRGLSTAISGRPAAKATRPDCETPFTIDDKGHKHYKAACL